MKMKKKQYGMKITKKKLKYIKKHIKSKIKK